MPIPDNLYLGTSSWSSPDWVGPFYPANLKPGQFRGLRAPLSRRGDRFDLLQHSGALGGAGLEGKDAAGFYLRRQDSQRDHAPKSAQRLPVGVHVVSFHDGVARRPLGAAAAAIPLLQPERLLLPEPVRKTAAPFSQGASQGIQIRPGDSQQELDHQQITSTPRFLIKGQADEGQSQGQALGIAGEGAGS